MIIAKRTVLKFYVKSRQYIHKHMTCYTLFFDGCSKSNPGVSGAGAVIYNDGVEIYAEAVFVGERETNNIAEYTGMIIGMTEAIRRNIRILSVKGDSQLVIKQMKGEYKVKSPNLLEIYKHAKSLAAKFDMITFEHVYRDDNTRADELSNEGIAKYIRS